MGGKPIIRHIIDNLKAIGFDDIIVSVGYLAEELQKAIGEDEAVRYFADPYEDYGTASVLKALDEKGWLESEFMVCNGDTLTNVSYADMIEEHLVEKNIATIFTQHHEYEQPITHNGGTYIFDREVIKYIGEKQNIPDLIQKLADESIPYQLYFRDNVLDQIYYIDCGTHAGLEKARRWYE